MEPENEKRLRNFVENQESKLDVVPEKDDGFKNPVKDCIVKKSDTQKIDDEYSKLAMQYGDLVFNKEQIDLRIQATRTRMAQLVAERAKLTNV